jgi:hypothetical protein
MKRLFSAFVLCLPLLFGACGRPSANLAAIPPPGPPATPTPTLAASAAGLALVATDDPAPADATSTSVPTSTPPPTPTPVPLPQVCLQPAYAHDVEDCGEIPRYEIVLVVDPAAARVTGSQEIRYTNLEDETLTDVYLRLFPGTPAYGGEMTVTHLLVDGQVVTPVVELEETALRLPMVPPLAVGRSIVLSMDFVVDVPTTGQAGHALFSYLRGVMALPTVYPIIPVYDDEGWNVEIAPAHSDDIYSDIAVYQVQITAPTAMTLAASGSCVRQLWGIDTTTWACEAAPMRDFVLILGERFELANRLVNDVVVNSYFYPQHARGGGRALEVAASALEAFTELFGPYPYAELDVVETPNYLGVRRGGQRPDRRTLAGRGADPIQHHALLRKGLWARQGRRYPAWRVRPDPPEPGPQRPRPAGWTSSRGLRTQSLLAGRLRQGRALLPRVAASGGRRGLL